MEIKTIKTTWAESELKQNTHVIEFEDGCLVIDAGCVPEQVKQLTNKPIKAVLLTHAHFDHIKHVQEYDKLGIKVYAHKATLEMLKNETNNASVYFDKPTKYKINNLFLLVDQDELEIGELNIKCLYTPGHTIDSVCYLINNEHLFTGDTVFSVAVGRTDLPTGNVEQLIKSLQRIQNLNYFTLYSGHGRVSNKEEQKVNIPKWIDYLKQIHKLKEN